MAVFDRNESSVSFKSKIVLLILYQNNPTQMKRSILSVITSLFFFYMSAQDKWDVSSPIGNFKEVTIATDEGTWMNLDVSPDGKQIVFDLLGDIYLLPIEGGNAKLLRGGHAFEVQPRFSPDGASISFTSDGRRW